MDTFTEKEGDLPDLSILLGCCYLFLCSSESCLNDGIILYLINVHSASVVMLHSQGSALFNAFITNGVISCLFKHIYLWSNQIIYLY